MDCQVEILYEWAVRRFSCERRPLVPAGPRVGGNPFTPGAGYSSLVSWRLNLDR